MSNLLKRQLTDSEKAECIKQHGRICFATGHEIPPDETLHFDHIKAYSDGFPSELHNIAPMCAQHNLQKGKLSLEDFRTKLQMNDFFAGGDKLTLKHLLEYMKAKGQIARFGDPVSTKECDGHVIIESASQTYSQVLSKCPTTGWTYF